MRIKYGVAEEKITPPDETLWKELIYLRYKKPILKNIPFIDMRAYINEKSQLYQEVMCTFNFFEIEIALKFLSIKIDKEDGGCSFYFLKLSDGRWQKGKVNANYSSDVKIEKINEKEKILKLIITLETENGPRVRIFRKKI